MTYKKLVAVLVTSGVAVTALADGDMMMESNNAASAHQPPANPEGTMQTPMLRALTAQEFVNDATVGGMKEIQFSEAALNESKNAEVRAFASKMVADHTLANRKLERIARQEGLSCPSTNTFAADDPNWRNPLVENPASLKGEGAYLLMTNGPDLTDYEALHHLKELSGPEFDLTYVRNMVSDHINAVNEFEAASDNLSDPALRKFAKDTLPTLREHSQMAQKLENQLTGQTAEGDSGKPVTAAAGGM